MVPAGHVLAFAAVVAVLIAIPGPSVLFTVSRALTVGRVRRPVTVVRRRTNMSSTCRES